VGFAPKVRQAEPKHAVDAMIDTIRAHPGIVLVTLGPLTNVALALQKDPGIAKLVSRCVVMGGNPCCVGNVTPAAEYNIWCDPEAADVVFRSGLPVELVGWHLCRFEATFNSFDIGQMRALQTRIGDFAVDCNRIAAEANLTQTGEPGIALPDPTAMAIALDPTIATQVTSHAIAVETTSELTRGLTVIDQLNVSGDARNRGVWSNGATGRAAVVWTLDVARFKKRVIDALR
jgi:purine nucleosidase